MNIIITRIDPLGGIPNPDVHGSIISTESCDSWDEVIAALKPRGVHELSAHHLSDFHAESPRETITFQHREFLDLGMAACTVNVNYVIEVRP